jgi:hypothetical protein
MVEALRSYGGGASVVACELRANQLGVVRNT